MLLGMAHGDDVIEADLQVPGAGAEADELRAVRSVDVVDDAGLPLRHAVEVELQLYPLLMHRRGFQLVVVVTRNRAVRFRIHGHPSASLHFTFDAEPLWYALPRVRLR